MSIRIVVTFAFLFSSALAAAPAVTRFEMRNVSFHFDDTLVLEIRRMSGDLRPTRPGAIPTFDDKSSFILDIEEGEAALSATALAHLMNRYVLAGPNPQIKNLEIAIAGGKIRQKGKMHKGIDLPFEIVSDIEALRTGSFASVRERSRWRSSRPKVS